MGKRGPRDSHYLTRRQRTVIQLSLECLTHEQISRLTGFSRQWVTTLCNSPGGREYAAALLARTSPKSVTDQGLCLDARMKAAVQSHLMAD